MASVVLPQKKMSLLLQYDSAGNNNNHPKASRKYNNASTQTQECQRQGVLEVADLQWLA